MAIDRALGDGQYTCLVRKDWEASGVELSGMEDPVEEDSGKEDFGGEDSGKESGHLDIKEYGSGNDQGACDASRARRAAGLLWLVFGLRWLLW
jgi:hypothetical protein